MLNNVRDEHTGRVTLAWLANTWLPPIIGILVICCESTQGMGTVQTSRFLRPFFEWVFGPIQDSTWDPFHHYLRKTGHFCEYGTISLLFLRAWYKTLCLRTLALGHAVLPATPKLSRLQVMSIVLAIASTFLLASSDEFHQTFLPGRTGLFSDVLIYTSGALVFHLFFGIYLSLRRRENATS